MPVPIQIKRALAGTPVAIPPFGPDGEMVFAVGGFTNAPTHAGGSDLVISDGVGLLALVGPTRQVELIGSQTITGPKTFPIASIRIQGGTLNQILTTDGAGNLTWTTASAGGIGDAPGDSTHYGRVDSTWERVLPLVGGSLSGSLTFTAGDIVLFQDPTIPMHAVNKQYVDDIIAALSGVLVLAGTYNVTADDVTPGGTASGMIAGPLPPATLSLNNRYLIITVGGIGTGNAPAVAMTPGSWLVCDGTAWVYVDVAQPTQDASAISVVPPVLGANNVQAALVALSTQPIITDTSLTGTGVTGTPLALALVDGGTF